MTIDQICRDLMKRSCLETVHMKEALEREDFAALEELTRNRQRIIGRLAGFGKKLTNLKGVEGLWKDLSIWAEKLQKLDQSLIDSIEHRRKSVSVELTFLFKQKAKFKGYNLNNVK